MAQVRLVSFLLIAFLAISSNSAASVESNEAAGKEIPKTQVTNVEVKSDSGAENRAKLIKTLFENYDKRNYYSNNTLKFGLALTRLIANEADHTLEIDGWMRMNWTDPRLRWDVNDYGGESVFRFPASDIWTPDISLYNTADAEHSVRCRETNVLIYNTGSVLWVPSCRIDVLCSNLTMDSEPYALQKCELKFGSWTFDGSLMDLQHFGMENVDLQYMQKSRNWDVLESTAKRTVNYYSCCKEPYVTLDIWLTFQRKANSRPGCSH